MAKAAAAPQIFCSFPQGASMHEQFPSLFQNQLPYGGSKIVALVTLHHKPCIEPPHSSKQIAVLGTCDFICSMSCFHDLCNAAGAVREGLWVMSLGTSGTLFGATKQPILDPSGGVSPFCSTDGQWLPLLCTMNCTTVTEEVRSCPSTRASAKPN